MHRAGVECFADAGVGGADQDGGEHQPGDPAADEFAAAIDEPRQGKQGRHETSGK